MLDAAAEWGIPPWQVEDEVSLEWWRRWMFKRNEETRRDNKQRGKKPGLLGAVRGGIQKYSGEAARSMLKGKR